MRRLALALLALSSPLPAHAATTFTQTNLVTNNPVANPATLSDPSLVNPWGVSMSPTSPFWVSDNGTHVATLYNVDPATQATSKAALTVSILGDGSVTGQAANPAAASGAFNGDTFLFVNEDGTISGWRAALGTNAEVLKLSLPSNAYKGAAVASIGADTYLYAANFRTGTIDVLKGSIGSPSLPGSFTDPVLPAGFAPFNIQNLAGKLYVAYAKTTPSSIDETAGPGLGVVDAFDFNGIFLGRVASQGTLNAPWGLTIAPASFGEFAGDLLVGNFGDGRISAFNLANNSFAGQLNSPNNLPLSIPGLWALTTGNGTLAGSANAVYFSAGPNNQTNGLFGVLTVPEPATLLLSPALLLPRRPRRR
jgi:uncharacterized protein (TIGR03118 family)